MNFEVYKEKFRITEWKNGHVYGVESIGEGWFLESDVKANVPTDTNILYTDKIHPEGLSPIRKAQTS